MQNNGDRFNRILFCAFLISLYTLGFVFILRVIKDINPLSIITPENIAFLRKKEAVENIIESKFYQETNGSDLEIGALRGIVDSLGDPYAAYYTAEEFAKFNENISGQYAGIGAALIQDPTTNMVYVSEVFKDSPAELAGLIEGDTIVSADGHIANTMTLTEFVNILRGEENTTVTVSYEREGTQSTVNIIRKIVSTTSIYYNMMDEDTGYMQITDFQSSTYEEFKNSIADLQSQGMENIIFDLRGNPGGYVKSVTDILDEILPAGVVVYLQDKEGNRINYESDEKHKMDLPCIVLVDEKTASSSEIFSGAIRDFNYGQIVGTTTTGKGVVQNTFIMDDGSVVKLTIAEYFTPKGTKIHKNGVIPDIELEYEYTGPTDQPYDQKYDNQIQKALEILNPTS